MSTQSGTLYQHGPVTVTPTVVFIAGVNYPVNGISSYRTQASKPDADGYHGLLIIMGVLAVLSVLGALSSLFSGDVGDFFGGLLTSAFLAAIGWCCWWRISSRKVTYRLWLRTAGGEISAYQSVDGREVEARCWAIGQAVQARG